MAARSSIEQLPPAIKTAVDHAIKSGATVDVIVEKIRTLGGEASRSAVGRYSKKFAQLAAQQRQVRDFAQAFGHEFGEEGDLQGRIMVQLMTSMITRTLIPMASGENPDLETKELGQLARAVKDATSAAKMDVEREAKIRDETAKRVKAAAADAAVETARRAGSSEETLRNIRAGILGLSVS